MRRALLAGGGLALAGLLVMPVDVPIAQFCAADGLPGELERLLQRAETFGHGYGVVLIVATIFVVHPASRRRLPQVLVCSLGAGLAANVVKLLVARTRPRAFNLARGVLDSFQGLVPITGPDGWNSLLDHNIHAFPSAHAATAAGLAVALGRLYPLGRWWFAALATLVCFQRIAVGAHFPSDTLCGAALGLIFSSWCLRPRPAADAAAKASQGNEASLEAATSPHLPRAA